MNNTTIGDQQESRLWWLGGIIDGEGCITINHHRLHKATKKETLLFTPIIAIVNTNKKLIDTCIEIFEEHEIPYWVQYVKPTKSHWKPKWQIHIRGLKRVSKALTIISPYIISKENEARLVKRFCDIRINGERTKSSYGTLAYSPYGNEEFEIIYEVAKIHNRNPQRLYAEISNYITKQDKVRTVAKSTE